MTTETQVEPVEGLADELERVILVAEADMADDLVSAEVTGERPDLYDYVIELSVADARAILAALRSSTVNDELVEALLPFAKADERQIRLAGERGLKDGNASVLIPRLALRRARAALAKIGGESNA